MRFHLCGRPLFYRLLLVAAFLFQGAAAHADTTLSTALESKFVGRSDGSDPNDKAGTAVALAGDVAAVGVPGETVQGLSNAGAVCLYRRDSATGAWTLSQRLIAAAPDENGLFGSAVVLKGGLLFVGAPFGQAESQGAVHAFKLDTDTNTWTYAQILYPPTADVAGFGAALAFDGTSLVVGAPRTSASVSAKESGCACVYTRPTSQWVLQARLDVPIGAASNQHVGQAVAVEGGRIVVGGPGLIVNSRQGAAAIFEFTGNGNEWAWRTFLTPLYTTAQGGAAVALRGDMVAVGSPGVVSSFYGAVDLYNLVGASWSYGGRLQPSVMQGYDSQFGSALAFTDSCLVVGAPRDGAPGDVPGVKGGSVRIFELSSGNWTQTAKLGAALPGIQPLGGASIAVEGDRILAGVPGAVSSYGAAVVFDKAAGIWEKSAELTRPDSDGRASDRLGTTVAMDGDTALVASPTHRLGSLFDGLVLVLRRIDGQWVKEARLAGTDELSSGAVSTGSGFGSALALQGNLAVVGAPSPYGSGKAFLFRRDGVSWVRTMMWDNPAPTSGAGFGAAVALDADTIAIAEPAAGAMTPVKGKVHLLRRSGQDWIAEGTLTANDGTPGDWFGASLALRGDTLVINAPSAKNAKTARLGTTYVFVRVAGKWAQKTRLTPPGLAGDEWPSSVALNGDTLLLGFSGLYSSTSSGRADVFVRATGSTWTHQATLHPTAAGITTRFGASVALAGDVAVIGAPKFEFQEAPRNPGNVYVFARYAGVWQNRATLAAPQSGGPEQDRFGASVAMTPTAIVAGAPIDAEAPGFESGSAVFFDLQTLPDITVADGVGLGEVPLISDQVTPVKIGEAVINTTARRTFTIRNIGDAPLTGLVVTLSGSEAAQFAVVQPVTTTVATAAATTFEVRFTPTAEGSRSAVLHIASNDPNEAPFSVPLSGIGTLTAAAPSITQVPLPRIVRLGDRVQFLAEVTGSAPLVYQWLLNGHPVPGATDRSLTLPATTLAQGGNYSVRVQNAKATQTSGSSPLAVVGFNPAVTVNQDQTLILTVPVGAPAGTLFAWQKNDMPLANGGRVSGADKAKLVISRSAADDDANYQLGITLLSATANSDEIDVFVRLRPVVTTTSLGPWAAGKPVTDLLTATNAPTKFTITGLPLGVQVAASGQLSGSPRSFVRNKAGQPVASLRITASNAAGSSPPVTVEVPITLLPFAVGSHQGLIYPSGISNFLGGGIQFDLTSLGIVTGAFRMGQERYPFSTQVQWNGNANSPWTFTITTASHGYHASEPRVPGPTFDLVLTMALDLNKFDHNGAINPGSNGAASVHTQFGDTEDLRSPWPAYHTAAVKSPAGAGVYPMGAGHLQATVVKKAVSWAGKLADGAAFTASTQVSIVSNEMALYCPLYAGKGSAQGWQKFTRGHLFDATWIDGTLYWYKQQIVHSSRSYPYGFAARTTTVTGGSYQKPATGLPFLTLSAAPGYLWPLAILPDGVASATQTMLLSSKNVATLVSPSIDPTWPPVALTINATTGTITGTVAHIDDDPLHPGSKLKRTAKFSGIAVQRLGICAGEFQLPEIPLAGQTLLTSPTISGLVLFGAQNW